MEAAVVVVVMAPLVLRKGLVEGCRSQAVGAVGRSQTGRLMLELAAAREAVAVAAAAKAAAEEETQREGQGKQEGGKQEKETQVEMEEGAEEEEEMEEGEAQRVWLHAPCHYWWVCWSQGEPTTTGLWRNRWE